MSICTYGPLYFRGLNSNKNKETLTTNTNIRVLPTSINFSKNIAYINY